jgi:hypothetical protein
VKANYKNVPSNKGTKSQVVIKAEIHL